MTNKPFILIGLFIISILYQCSNASSSNTKQGKFYTLPSRSASPRYSASSDRSTSNVTSIPADGAYVIWRNDALIQTADQVTLQIGNEANQYTTMPDYSGQTSSATYTFSQFNFDINLEQPTLSSPGAPSITVGWELFEFIFVFNYHICSTSWPNPCEDGWIEVYTTDSNTKLFASLTLDLSGSSVSLVADSVELSFNEGDVEIYVQCTNTFCLIPTDDIANAVAGQFVSTFQTGIQTSINNAAKTLVDTISTSFILPDMPVTLELDGSFVLTPASKPNMVLVAHGLFTPDDQTGRRPPFSPTVVPPDSIFNSPASQLTVIYTDYLLRTAIWAMDLEGEFNKTITNADLPSTSPVHLTTNDPAIQGAVPAVAQYPNMDITVYTSLDSISSVDISSSSGVGFGNTILAKFVLSNSTYSHDGWTLLLDIGFNAKMTTNFNTTLNEIVISSSLGNWQVNVSVVDSALGTVNPMVFQGFIQLALSFDPPNVPQIPIPTPADWSVSSPSISVGDGYGWIGSTLTYAVNVPCEVCGGGAHACPLENTCCQWGGVWGCCTLPSASCCSGGGCCPNGSSCDGQGGCQ